jgi:hypothetical protein
MIGSVVQWIRPPDLFGHVPPTLDDKDMEMHNGEYSPAKRRRVSVSSPQVEQPAVLFKCVLGGWSCGLYLRDGTRTPSLRDPIDPVSAMLALTESSGKKALWDYTCGLTRAVTMPMDFHVNAGISLLARKSEIPNSICNSLHALSAAGDVFESIQVPTISLEAISKPLGETLWSEQLGDIKDDYALPDLSRYDPTSGMVPRKLTREQAFACVIYLDTGRIDLDPEDLTKVLAVSLDNSLYIAGRVLSDPADAVHHTIYVVSQVVLGTPVSLF